MGLSSSKNTPTGKNVVAAKLESSSKTGVLNLSEQGLKPSSSIWAQLSSPAMIDKIRSVDLSGNPLKTMPVEVFLLLNIKILKAPKCKLNTLYDLTSCEKLTQLKLDHNELTADSIGPLPVSITQCSLSFNRLEQLPPVLLSLVHLTELELNGNRITSLTEICSLVGLQSLSLDDNLVLEVPAEVAHLVRLRRLSLRNNRLNKRAVSWDGYSIASEVFQSTNLDSIDLFGNTELRNVDVYQFEGVEHYLERRKAIRDKALSGGALSEGEVFGLQ